MNTVAWSRRVRFAAAGVAVAMLTGSALGQYGHTPKAKSSANKSDEPPPIIDRVQSHDWTLTATVSVRLDQHERDKNGMPLTTGFRFDTMSMVFPMLAESASHIASPPLPSEGADEGKRYCTGKLSLNGKVVEEHPAFLSDYPCGTRLGKWTYQNWEGQSVLLEVTLPVTCYQTKFDEKQAQAVGWPSAWPAVAQSCFQPQYWIDEDPAKGPYDMAPVKDFVNRATGGKDPKTAPPALLAKILAGQILESIQPSGQGLTFDRTGELQGVDLQGAPETIRTGKGSEFDVVCALAAVYRAAGIPARTVIGFDVGQTKTDGRRFLGKHGSSELRSWVEFPLVSPKDGSLVWVPVDVIRMRKSGSRMKPVDQRWPYFGDHDELDRVIPFAFQFHPPTTVVSYGSPAFWGWLVTPKPPDMVAQSIRFMAITTPVTADDQKRKQDEERAKRNANNNH